MPSFKVHSFLGLVLFFCILMAGCGGGKPVTYQDLKIAKTNPTAAVVGVPYGFTFAATGGKVPYTWSVSAGALPDGLSLNASTGAISGTPSRAATYPFTIQCTDTQTPTAAVATQNFSINVTPLTPLAITTTTLTGAVTNSAYSATLAAKGGAVPYTWTVDSGSLPTGLTLSSAGVISGVPTVVGTSTFTVKVTDSQPTPATATQVLTLVVSNPTTLTITTTSLQNAFLNNVYTATLGAFGGIKPYTWSLAANSTLPPGLTLNASGVISGTPTALGTTTFTVQVKDTETPAQTATATLSIAVVNVSTLVVTTTALPNATVNVAYNGNLAASGGIAPYTWSLVSGSLPAGLTLSPTGSVTGTPTQLGTSTFTVQVKDTETTQQTATGTVTLIVSTLGNNLLNGNFAFYLNGFSNGSPMFMAGSLVSDGNGNITSGQVDVTLSTGTTHDTLATTSSYTIKDNGVGTVTLNTLTLGTFTLQVSAPLSGSTIRFILNNDQGNATGHYGSGALRRQDTTAFNISLFNGVYVFGLSGVDGAGGRLGRIGTQTITAGVITAGQSDVNDAGTLTSPTTPTGTYGAIDTTGRGTAAFNDSNVTTNYIVYVVSTNELILLEAESATPAPKMVGTVLKQFFISSGGSNLSGNAILQISGVTGTDADVSIGTATFTSSAKTFTATLNEKIGAGSVIQSGYSGSFDDSTSLGHVTFSGTTPLPVTMYLSSPGSAFVLGTGASVEFGSLEPQNAIAFTNANITGSYLGASINPVLVVIHQEQAGVTNEADAFTSDGNGNLTAGVVSTSGSDGDTQTTTPIGGSYSVDKNGRAMISVTAGESYVGYVVSVNKFVQIPSSVSEPTVIVMQK